MNAKEINRTYDLPALVERYTTLKKSGVFAIGRCPLPGCTSQHDALNLKQTPDGWRWLCRKCGDGKYHTPIDFVMRLDGLDFKTALSQMGGETVQLGPAAQPVQPVRPALTLPDATWQKAAWQVVDAGIDALDAPAGQLVREYLTRRGLHRGTWYAWHIGAAVRFDPSVKRNRPAVVLPWFDGDLITAVKYRFIDPDPAGLRFIQMPGSVPVLYGVGDVLTRDTTLLLVEGEMNALSVWQCHPADVSVVSFGSETGARPGLLQNLAKQYRRVFIWADDPRRAAEIGQTVPGAVALRSPVLTGVKHDANQMLQQGVLPDVLSRVLGVPCLGALTV